MSLGLVIPVPGAENMSHQQTVEMGWAVRWGDSGLPVEQGDSTDSEEERGTGGSGREGELGYRGPEVDMGCWVSNGAWGEAVQEKGPLETETKMETKEI